MKRMKVMYFVKTSAGASKMPKCVADMPCRVRASGGRESNNAVIETKCEKQEAYHTMRRDQAAVSPYPHSKLPRLWTG